MTGSPSAPSPVDRLGDAERRAWKEHRRLLLEIPTRDVWRGCLGLALAVTDPSSGAARPK